MWVLLRQKYCFLRPFLYLDNRKKPRQNDGKNEMRISREEWYFRQRIEKTTTDDHNLERKVSKNVARMLTITQNGASGSLKTQPRAINLSTFLSDLRCLYSHCHFPTGQFNIPKLLLSYSSSIPNWIRFWQKFFPF